MYFYTFYFILRSSDPIKVDTFKGTYRHTPSSLHVSVCHSLFHPSPNLTDLSV